MSSICIDKIKTYISGDNSEEFVKTSLSLFSNELIHFQNSIEYFIKDKNEKDFKQAIHKIKPNFELFIEKKEILDKLLYLYGLNFSSSNNQFDNLVYEIYYHVKRLINETNDLILKYKI